jgi:hypothetical protein
MAWVYKANLNTARYGLAGAGLQNAALAFAGYNGGNLGTTEAFNGTSWSSKNSLNTARSSPAGAGLQNSALVFGGWGVRIFIIH